MFDKFRNNITVLLLGAFTLCACSGPDTLSGQDDANPDNAVYLNFSVTLSNNTGSYSPVSGRALVTVPDDKDYFEPEASDYEKIHTLRVIILRPEEEGLVVEHNRCINEADGQTFSEKELEFKVKGGEKKTIYLIANEAGAGTPLPELTQGSVYTEGELENLIIETTDDNLLLYDNRESSNNKKHIPMGEVYQVYVPLPQKETDRFDAGTMFVTRAAVKFSFNITATYGDGLYLTAIAVHGLADREYLLPHNTEYYPAKPSPGIENPPTVPHPGLKGHFITQYDIPADTRHLSYTWQTEVPLSGNGTLIAPEYYFCESKHKRPETAPDDTPYSVSITLTDKTGNEHLFTGIPLPNLPILPRNTHVKVNIHIGDEDKVDCEVELVPYTGVWLDPDFGIDRKEPNEPNV